VPLTQAVSCKAEWHANIICLLHVWTQLAEQILQSRHGTARHITTHGKKCQMQSQRLAHMWGHDTC
jgi:hypothetical protein